MKKIILASTSPRRKELLSKVGLKFRAVGSNVDEKLNPRLKPRSNAEALSVAKASAVAKKYIHAIIIAADTFVVLNDEILGKPENEQRARRMLGKLSGNEFEVITGFTIIDTQTNKSVTKSVVTKVKMKKLTRGEIDAYVASGEPLDAAGSFKMQEKGAVLIEKIDGDYFNIVGLPLHELSEELKKFEVKIIE